MTRRTLKRPPSRPTSRQATLTASLGALSLSFGAALAQPHPEPSPPLAPVVTPPQQAPAPISSTEALERFVSASNASELVEALEGLRERHANSLERWFAEARYAELTLNVRDLSAASLKALSLSEGSEGLVAYTDAISRWELDQEASYTAELLKVARAHPHAPTRAAAAWSVSHSAHYRADTSAYTEARALLKGLLPLSVIGTWDNDQGKGLDQPFPPEQGLDLKGRYQGKLMEVSWRSEYPLDPRGKLNLDELLSPNTWQIAYAASAVESPSAQEAQLRLSSTDPLKVWVNDELVLNLSRLDGWRFDGLLVPIKLRAGVNRVLIKSAQQGGDWVLAARLTNSAGEPLELKSVAADAPIAPKPEGDATPKVMGSAELVAGLRERFGLSATSAWGALALSELLGEVGLQIERVELMEEAIKRHPNSLLLKQSLAYALWRHGERGRAADLLSELYKAEGERLPDLVLDQARFWSQQHLDVKARAALRALIKRAPHLSSPRLELARLYRDKGWHAERCALIRDGLTLTPNDPSLYHELAGCEGSLGDPLAQREALAVVEGERPRLPSTLKRRASRAQSAMRLDEQLDAARDYVRAWPQQGDAYRTLAQAERAAGHLEAALKSLEAASELNPLDPAPYLLRAEWLASEGRDQEALAAWEAALERDPDNQGLSLRLSELRSTGAEVWMSDVPSEEQIAQVIAARRDVKPIEGADIINLIDDEVTLLNPDGSTLNVITTVAYAVNQEGRDELTKLYMSRNKGAQLMAAYAINPDDTRVEASSIRDGVVRFRQLEVGSVVVLQYRYHTRPSAYLTGAISRFWWFHTDSTQVRESRFVLWMPKDTPLHESPHAPPALEGEPLKALEREERVEGELKRVTWRMRELPPLVSEPRMPPARDMAYGIELSTVPSWEDMWTWERELLREAFRMSPKVQEVADEVVANAQSPYEKVLKIHEYVIEKIRYQQDYEHTIAGVKPHSAAQVLSRQYGDCKDKAVLFITMAKRAGVDAHFALVRTRNAGRVDTSTPSQQFNHAIVYVPQQEGISEGRFFDPTVDTLDIETLRSDDQGTTALVYEPATQTHSWREIPFQSEAFNATRDDISLTLNAEGRVEGTLTLTGRGDIGQLLRQRARNPEAFKQLMQYRLHQLFPGAEMSAHEPIEVESLFKPASASISFTLDHWAKREGEQLRVPALIDWTPKGYFHLEERRFPLNFGERRSWSWRAQVTLPQGYEVSHLPSSEVVKTGCLSLERSFKVEGRELITEWRYASTCERIEPQDYQAERAKAREMMVLLNQEVVLSKRELEQQKERLPVPAPAPNPAP